MSVIAPPPDTLSNSRIEAAYRDRTPGSFALHREAMSVLPSGIAHDARHMKPYGIYVERAKGPRKWDVDGNEYIDFYGGHGALLMGHGEPRIEAAVARQLAAGTHYGTCHPLEVKWAKLIQELVPCAERVRFTASGTEATLMALRLARAYSGRGKVVRFQGHFHGWHDHMAFGVNNHFDGSVTPGVLPGIGLSTVLLPPNDIEAVRHTLQTDPDIAALICEPTGASTGKIPMAPSMLRALRELTAKHDVILIFDEVVTGFRVAPGGAQEWAGVTPDMCSLAKIVAGGLPGGAVAGRRDLLDLLDHDATTANGRERINHQGTYNGNPCSAAAGAAMLEIIRDENPCARATATAQEILRGMNDILAEERVPWAVYGQHSVFHFWTNPDNKPLDPRRFDANAEPPMTFKKTDPRNAMLQKLRIAMLVNGVDLKGWRGGIVSAVHGPKEVDQTLRAWRESLRMLKAEGEIA